MNWRDLLYFSKGERRALTLLLCLITISWILLLWTGRKAMPVASETDAHRTGKRLASEERRIITGKDTTKEEKESIRKESGLHPRVNENTLKGKNPTLKGSSPYPTGKTRKAYKPYVRTEKFPEGTLVELNAADTTTLKKVPGIGSAFARRIVKYRELLGGFYTVGQLTEVYGIDEERYAALAPWFFTDTLYIHKLNVNALSAADLRRHPYIDYRQAQVIEQLRKQKSRLSGWENLQLIEEFTDMDRKRLRPYLSFQ
ncbi:helix-hairpin-helix domain-containing protein [uncultured Parabacteroides sp.]|uniref:helix-hairpin-helix domain-containing protein n=1 Tax=uncultured Parabacteroides sp. TaxID=512312 RepID=UPI0025EABE11|nr:helix-hairpin-helix domain-containing protein [uncultured Parabacteroides sp.]